MPAKKKRMTIKEATARVLANNVHIEAIGKEAKRLKLEVNRLENEVESLEGARANLKMMYDTHEIEKNLANQAKIDALASLRESQRQTDRACDVAEKFRDQVRTFENEGAVDMWVRSMKQALKPARKAISSFFERVTFRKRRK